MKQIKFLAILRIRMLYYYYKFIKYPKLIKWRWLIPWKYNKENLNLNYHIILYDNKICFIEYNFLCLDEKFRNLKLINFITYPIRMANYRSELFHRGKFHRVDGPAIEDLHGTKKWYIYEKLHRVDGPAVEDPNGTKKWYLNGKLHREDGPAVEDPNGNNHWYLNGKSVHEKEIVLKNFKFNLKFEN